MGARLNAEERARGTIELISDSNYGLDKRTNLSLNNILIWFLSEGDRSIYDTNNSPSGRRSLEHRSPADRPGGRTLYRRDTMGGYDRDASGLAGKARLVSDATTPVEMRADDGTMLSPISTACFINYCVYVDGRRTGLDHLYQKTKCRTMMIEHWKVRTVECTRLILFCLKF